MEYTKQQLQERLKSLPQDIRDALFAAETADVIEAMEDRYDLTPEQVKNISKETGYLMMGITKPQDYVQKLTKTIGVPRDKASFIAQEVNRTILHPIRDSLKQIHGVAKKTEGASSSTEPKEPPTQQSAEATIREAVGTVKGSKPAVATQPAPKAASTPPAAAKAETPVKTTEKPTPAPATEKAPQQTAPPTQKPADKPPVSTPPATASTAPKVAPSPATPTPTAVKEGGAEDNVFEKKLGGMFRVKPEEQGVTEATPKTANSTDPYREPVEDE